MQQVKTEREQHGWSVGELAMLSGVAPATIDAIEAGRLRPTSTELDAIEEALDLEPPLEWWQTEAVTNGDAMGYLARRIAEGEGLEGHAVTARMRELEDEAREAVR